MVPSQSPLFRKLTAHLSPWAGEGGAATAIWQPGAGNDYKCLCLTEKKLPQPESKGVVIVAVIVCTLVLAVLGAALYFFYKKGKLPCGRSGKQEM